MARRKRNREDVASVIGLGGTSIALGLTGTAVAGVGGNTGGLTAAAGFLPVAGSVVGAQMVFGRLKDLEDLGTRKKRRR